MNCQCHRKNAHTHSAGKALAPAHHTSICQVQGSCVQRHRGLRMHRQSCSCHPIECATYSAVIMGQRISHYIQLSPAPADFIPSPPPSPPPLFPHTPSFFLPWLSFCTVDTQHLATSPAGEDPVVCMQAVSNQMTELQLQVLQWHQIGRTSLLATALKTSPKLLSTVAAENEMPLGLLCPQKSVIAMAGLLCAALCSAVL